MENRRMIGVVLVAIGVLGFVIFLPLYATQQQTYTGYGSSWGMMGGMMGQWYQRPQAQSNPPITLEQAKTTAQQYLASTGNSNLAIKEIMEFQYSFYIIYYEKDTGIGAFEMLIWKQTPTSGTMGGGMGMGAGGMMGGSYATIGAIVPEPGPNMMWNTKYNPMGQGMMGNWNRQYTSGTTIANDQAAQIAQTYLDSNFKNAEVEMATQFYGYYTFDFTVNGKIAGMLSVNTYTGQVWYHSWHGTFIQEVEFD